MVHPQIREKIPDSQVGPPVLVPDKEKDTGGDCETHVAQQDQFGILCLIQRARRVEVVDAAEKAILLALATAFGLTLMVVVTGDVGGNVIRPANQLLADHVKSGVDGGLFRKLGKLMNIISHPRGKIFTSLRYKDHVTVHVTCSLMVLSVGYLPGKVRH